jgi:hypothetical protein
MGVTIWYFVRSGPGELHPLPRAQVERFFDGAPLSHEDRVVRYVQVVVRVESRKAVEVGGIGYFQHRVLPDGTLDRAHLGEVMALASEAAFGGVLSSEPSRGVVEASHRFAQRRLESVHQWKPSQAELAALRALVNRKAARRLL